jgi:predicted transcriptional regulator
MQERELKMLIRRNAIQDVVVRERAARDGFYLVIDGELLVSARRGSRRFASLDSAASLLRSVGIHRFPVQLAVTGETVSETVT